MLTLGWALAAVAGSLAGLLIAPDVFVGPNNFDAVTVFAFTAAVVGRLRGGLAMAAVMASAAFGAICGSSIATAATITGVALPEILVPLGTRTMVRSSKSSMPQT